MELSWMRSLNVSDENVERIAEEACYIADSALYIVKGSKI
jgi:hypothetical protein